MIRVLCSGHKAWGVGFLGLGFRVKGLGFREGPLTLLCSRPTGSPSVVEKILMGLMVFDCRSGAFA